MKVIQLLVSKDFKSDLRNRYPVLGILLYLTTLIVISYFTFANILSIEIWNALFWMILLFISVNAIARSFIQEENRSSYYYFLAPPTAIITAKLIYYFAYQLSLSLVALLLYSVMLGNAGGHAGLFFLNLLLGSVGLSSAFAMISSIAAKTTNQSAMMAILGFPVIIPIMILSVSNSQTIILGGSWEDIYLNMITLASVNVIIIAVAFILFPFVWKS